MDLGSEYQITLHNLWEHFIWGDDRMDYSPVRPEVLASWRRSRDFGVNPQQVGRDVLTPEALSVRLAAHAELMDVVHPYLEQILSLIHI